MVTVSAKLRNGLIMHDIKILYTLDKAKPTFKYAYRECARGRGQVFHLKWASLSFSGQRESEESSTMWFTPPRLNSRSESLLTYIYVEFLSCQNLPKFCAVFTQHSICPAYPSAMQSDRVRKPASASKYLFFFNWSNHTNQSCLKPVFSLALLKKKILRELK